MNIDQYIEEHTSGENEVLSSLNRETHLNVLMPNMLSGHVQGRLLSLLSHMLKPENILEIGTFTGYSGLCLAEGLGDTGRLYTIDINEELEDMVRKYFRKAGMEEKLNLLIGNAIEIIPGLNVRFDLVFIDADKVHYSQYYDLVFDKVRPGGYILADNVLWKGKVADPSAKDKDTLAIAEFNKKVQMDDRVENVLIPVRDGLMLIRKK